MVQQEAWYRKSYVIALAAFTMFFITQRRICQAFVPRLGSATRRAIRPTFHVDRIILRPTLKLGAVAKKSNFVRKQSLVVHGPQGFSIKSPPDRPFKLVIVESPSKCQTISKILKEHVENEGLDHDYVVTSCMGHIRNIPQQKSHKGQKVAGIDLTQGKYEPTYTILPEKVQLVEDLKELVEKCQQLILATDDDREGEAMAWHLLQVLVEEPKEQNIQLASNIESFPPLRVRFTEITPRAIVNSIFEHASENLRDNLVQAQETRRILDRLAGFTVSPILWKKIAPGLSAGRVQSVGMALIVQRERERLLFQETEYWDIEAQFAHNADTFRGKMVTVNGAPLASGGSDFEARKADQLTEASSHKVHLKQADAERLAKELETEEWSWTIANINQTQRKLNPLPPFITSSLQQEANKRLGLSVSQTMRTAQQLYEKGYISYMRTDSKHLSDDAKAAIRAEIIQNYGGPENFQPISSQRETKKSKKNKPEAQAAHEAIRPSIQPSGLFAKPGSLPTEFDGVSNELYTLIYQRTVASHMPPQVSNQTSIRVLGENEDSSVVFRTSGSVVINPGFSAVYPRQTESASPVLPALDEGERLDCECSTAAQHITQPPARYTEASFVQELETLGVGRPSTYAGTVQILRDRAYVGSPVSGDNARGSGAGKAVSGPAISAQRAAGGEEFTGARSARGPMVPSLSAFVVCSLFENHCNMYVDPTFTARMEERLDSIANAEETIGDEERIAYLDEFYSGENGLSAAIDRMDDVIEGDDARRAHLPALYSNATNENDDQIGLFVGPWGPYIKKVIPAESPEQTSDLKPVSAPLPAGMASDLSIITLESLQSLLATKESNGALIGQHPDDGRNVRLKIGRFGAFLQWGDDEEEGTTTHTLPASVRNMKNIAATEDGSLTSMLGITFEEAVQYVNLPRTVCTMEDRPIVAAIGPYGPYLKYNNTFITLKPADGDVLTISPEDAKIVVTEGLSKKSKLGAGVLADLGEKEGAKVTVKNGRFGSYINWKKVNAKLPVEYADNPSDVPLEEAWGLIQEKAGSTAMKEKKTRNGKSEPAVDLPPAPKRPISAYLHFCAEKRPEVSERATSLGSTSKELAKLWNGTSEADRIPYVKLAEASKEEYSEKKKAWTDACQEILAKADGASGMGSKAKSTKTTTSNTIKRPKSSYLYFCAEKRPEVAEKFVRLGEISKELARLWAATSEKDRKTYEKMALDDKARYAGELQNSGHGKASRTKKSKAAPLKVTKKKRGPSAYMLFCAAHRNSILDDDGKKLPLGETTKRLARMWKECDEKTKQEFTVEAERQKQAMV